MLNKKTVDDLQDLIDQMKVDEEQALAILANA